MELSIDTECVCMDEQCRSDAFEVLEIASEHDGGIHVKVELWCCLGCDRFWLRFSTVDEASGAWGKWYRGIIPTEAARDISADSATALFRAMSWHFYGGSYYRSAGERASGPIPIVPLERALPWAA